MRTTLDIDDAVLAAAKEVAGSRKSSAGAVISEWARKGIARAAHETIRTNSGFPMFSIPEDAKLLTSMTVATILADEGVPPRQ
jgi:hypothetical protein